MEALHEIHLGPSANGGSFFTTLKHETLQSTLSIHAHAKGSIADTLRSRFDLQSKAPQIGLLEIKIVSGRRGMLNLTTDDIHGGPSHMSISCTTEERADQAYQIAEDLIGNWILYMSNLESAPQPKTPLVARTMTGHTRPA